MQRHTGTGSLLLAVALSAFPIASPGTPPPVVERVDLERYLGTWYEIKKIPNRFQDQCAGDTTAHYSRRDDGRLRVINRCRTHAGTWDEAEGVARVLDPPRNAKLEVSFVALFGWNLFWGDYWIVDLAADYSHVIVGHPKRHYGWILARTPKLGMDLDARLRELGYDPADFEPTPHRTAP